MVNRDISTVVTNTKAYYDGPADEIYRSIWGDDIHLGLFEAGDEGLPAAAVRTNQVMAEAIAPTPATRIVDLGCGYGSTARHLARQFGCRVTGTNISEKELELARQRAAEAGLGHLLTFEYGDFHDLPYPDASWDVVWSQESFLHGVDKRKILSECRRVLVPGGLLAFTDILVRRDTPEADRARIYDRVKSPDIWDTEDYQQAIRELGFELLRTDDWSPNVARSYGWVRDRVREHRSALLGRIDAATVDRTIDALTFWVDSANAGKIGWAFFLARTPT